MQLKTTSILILDLKDMLKINLEHLFCFRNMLNVHVWNIMLLRLVHDCHYHILNEYLRFYLLIFLYFLTFHFNFKLVYYIFSNDILTFYFRATLKILGTHLTSSQYWEALLMLSWSNSR